MSFWEHSPRKTTVPLATGDERPHSLRSKSGPTTTKRAFFCGVVVENSGYGRQLPQDVQELVASLGEPIDLESDASVLPDDAEVNTDDSQPGDGPYVRKRALTDATALRDVINEFVTTERSYVKRLHTLKSDYADPLRDFSRNKNTAILQPYEAKTLFANIDQLLPVNDAFLEDLEKMLQPDGSQTVGGIGDVALKHFKEMKGFENYRHYYSKQEEAQAILKKEIRKASSFAAYIDRIKYSSAENKNRVGLRELLMEPVQRIPRYTLLWRTMIKFMAPSDPQRDKLIEADEIASKIALAETDEQTKRAALMYCLAATIEDFPPGLISNSRHFIDCIDVEDIVTEVNTASSSNGNSQVSANLHCTLFLFDDKLVITRRPGNEKSGRALSGLDDLEKSTKAGSLPTGLKKSGLACKGVVDVTDVVATDVSGPDIHIYLENPPQDQDKSWSGRSFRALSVVNPPAPINLDPLKTEADKKRFLENLWTAQARFRTKLNQSVLLCADDREVESRGGRVTTARTFYNVYQRTAFLKEAKKTKVVLHVDHEGFADPIPFGIRAPPFIVIRVQPMAGELSRYTVTSNDPSDEVEEDIVQTGRVPDRIVQTIHQYGLFKFRTGNNSMPSTPTSRSRTGKFGLDALSRNFMNVLPGTPKGDIFGGSINIHKRSKTAASRASVFTQSTNTNTNDGSLSRFSGGNSTVTSATSFLLIDDDGSTHLSVHSGGSSTKARSRSLSRAKQFIKRGKSADSGALSEPDTPSRLGPSRLQSTPSLPNTRSPSVEPELEDTSEWEGEEPMNLRASSALDESERDLVARLELARQNSQNQHEAKFVRPPMEVPLEDTIYEEPTKPMRSASRVSRDLPEIPDSRSQRSTTPRPITSRPTTPNSFLSEPDASPRRTRSTSRNDADRRPFGPRSPSPLPPANLAADTTFLTADDKDVAMEDVQFDPIGENVDILSPLPRSKRQTFEPSFAVEDTPKRVMTPSLEEALPIVPLSIKKKTSVKSNGSPQRRTYDLQRSPFLKQPNRRTSPQRNGSLGERSRVPIPAAYVPSTTGIKELERTEQLLTVWEATKEDLESAHRAVKRIKVEVEQARTMANSPHPGESTRPSSPIKSLRSTSQWNAAPTREAQARMEEMQRLIGKRLNDPTHRPRPLSMAASASFSRISDDNSYDRDVKDNKDTAMHNIAGLASQAEDGIGRATNSQSELLAGVESLMVLLKEKSAELEKARIELQGARRQTELVKSLLNDCTTEKEIMYEAFNEELDGMFNDANLPADEAWVAMTHDLRQTKETRNALSNENSNLKRKLAELELQNEEWGVILQVHGLISP